MCYESFHFLILQGGQSIFVSCGGQLSPLRKEVRYFLLFEGSKLRHITSTKYVNPFTLQAIIPGSILSMFDGRFIV